MLLKTADVEHEWEIKSRHWQFGSQAHVTADTYTVNTTWLSNKGAESSTSNLISFQTKNMNNQSQKDYYTENGGQLGY